MTLIKPGNISSEMTTDTELASEAGIRQSVDDAILAIHSDTSEPTGYLDRTQSTLSFDEATRTLSVAPVSTSFDVYLGGTKHTFSTTLTKQIPNTSGSYWFYINSSWQLDYSTTFSTATLSTLVYTAYVMWDSSKGIAVSFGEERHGCTMDSVTHGYLHTTRGTQLVSGASIGYVTTGDGTASADAEISISDLSVRDEDILVQITNNASPSLPFQQKLSPIAYLPIFYRTGTQWTKDTGTPFPIMQGTSRAKYNKNTAGTWSLEDASTDNKFLVSYVFATTNIIEPVIVLLGQDEYTSLADAQARSGWSKVSFGDLPAQEMKLMYIVIYETSSSYTNTVKSAVRYVTDIRFGADREASATSLNTAHSNLSGLGNDDHLQYHTDARGDARYYTKTLADSTFVSNTDITEKAQDAIGGALTNTTTINLSYNDNLNEISASVNDGSITNAKLSSGIDAAKIASGTVSNTEFDYLANVTSDIQSQLNGKQATGNYITDLTGDITASGPGSAVTTLANSGVTAGTYSLVTVDSKGRVTSGSNSGSITRYSYFTSANTTNTNATFTTVAALTSVSLPVGLYKVRFSSLIQSSATTNGIGLRVIGGTATISRIGIAWSIAQGSNGVSQNFGYDQVDTTTTTNITASIQAANTSYMAVGDGFLRVSVAGTVVLQMRSEVNANTSTLLADANIEYTLL